MDQLVQTIVVSSVIIGIAFVLLGIGWLLTGKKKLRGGTCGRDPTKSRDDDSCRSRCQLCEKDDDVQ